MIECVAKMEVIDVNQQIEAVQRMQDFIESHLDEEITLMKLAEVSFFRHGIPTGFSRNVLDRPLRNMSADCGSPAPLCV